MLVFIQISPKHSLPLFSFQPHLGLAILVPLVFVGVRVPHGSSLLACGPGRCKAQRLLNVLPEERAGLDPAFPLWLLCRNFYLMDIVQRM